MIENLKKNVKNKAWWVAVISLVVLIAQSKGFDLTKYIGEDWQTTLSNVFTLLTLIGISVDTTSFKESEVKADEEKVNESLQETVATTCDKTVAVNNISANSPS